MATQRKAKINSNSIPLKLRTANKPTLGTPQVQRKCSVETKLCLESLKLCPIFEGMKRAVHETDFEYNMQYRPTQLKRTNEPVEGIDMGSSQLRR